MPAPLVLGRKFAASGAARRLRAAVSGRRIASAAAALWPRACLLCEQACGDAPLCAPCWSALPGVRRRRCAVCAAPLPRSAASVVPCPDCERLRPVLRATFTAADYRPPLAEAITALKFGRQLGLASGLGLLLAHGLARRADEAPRTAGAAGAAQEDHADHAGHADHADHADHAATVIETTDGTGGSPLPAPDCLVPIPLSPTRLAERGFNQAEAIARSLARHWPPAWSPPPVLRPALLERVRDNPRQSSLAGAARLGNVGAVFVADHAVEGRCVGLVDDVMTTGATLDAAARALLAAGAASVSAFVVARTP